MPDVRWNRFVTLLSACALTLGGLALDASAAPAKKKGKKAAAEAADKAAEEDKKTWKVSEPPGHEDGQWREIVIDTEETTWSSVSVSPDGQTIAFDMLGDIYTVPTTGGEATALTDGIEWNVEPHYSPDGSKIAFVSDRGGADNVWVMNADGSDPKTITEEKTNLVHNPAWSPDGRFLAVKKGFTSRRSIPAGEIWLVHASGGGGGIQLIERPNGPRDQKTIAEPAFSPDGRYVYFSQDTTPGLLWEYNKDSTGQIFVIQRFDRETGETIVFVSGAGGAIRPTPSPDGKHLAFVKRLADFSSALYLKDLESGKEWPIYTGLDRDLQETNGSQGNAPAVSWTPDSREIVFWAGGKIHRVDVASGEVTPVPVRVKVTKKVAPALRFPIDVSPDRFPVRVLRWAQRTPDGNRVLFQALGHLWIRDWAGGEPRRLTSQNDHYEVHPEISRDGRWVVYTTWDDQELGSVRVVSIDGGEGRALTDEPGIYVEPTFSPDGSKVVFRRLQGGFLLSPLWGMEPGLYVVPTAGGEAERIVEDGFAPQFGAHEDRVFFIARTGPEEASLKSVDLEGDDERTHAKSSNVTEVRISPDGRWLAFVEDYNAHVAAFTEAGKAIDVSKGMGSLPVKQVSKRAGEFLYWSADSSALTWTHGPNFYQRELTDAFGFLEGAPEELPEPVAEGKDLSFEVAADRPEGTIALTGARVVTMRDARSGLEEVIENGTVVVDRHRIAAVGPADEVEIPAGARVIDVSGKTIIPGLVDVHAHGAMARSGITPEQNWAQLSNLAFGVTTIHDPSNDTDSIFAAAELQRAGRLVAPRIFSTGTILYGANSPGAHVDIDSLEDAKFHVQRLKDFGAISVKSYQQPRRDQRQQVIAAGRELGIMVVPEGGAKFQHNMNEIVDGHTGIEHSIPLARAYDDVVQLWSQTETGYSPTFGVAYGGLSGETYWYDRTRVWENERLMRYTPRFLVDPQAIRRSTAPDEHYNHFHVAAFAKELLDSGVRVLIGAHGQREGLAAHWEMWMMEQGGFTPWEAIRGATIDGAWYVGLDGDVGSIEPGKLADLAVIDGNPLEDLRRSEYVTHTMIGGRLYESATMNQLAPDEVARQPLFFELEGGDTILPGAERWIEELRERFGWVH